VIEGFVVCIALEFIALFCFAFGLYTMMASQDIVTKVVAQNTNVNLEEANQTKRFHPDDPSVAYTRDDFIRFCNDKGVRWQQLWDESVPEDLAFMSTRKVHPMDPTGAAWTFSEFHKFVGRDLKRAKNMWSEAKVVAPDLPQYGNWSGVVTSVATSDAICGDFESQYETTSKSILKRSLSEGYLTEMGRSTLRHPDGHPTATSFDKAWIAAS
jgi:hypothetical protein